MNELLADLQLGSSRSCNEPSVDKLQCGTVNPLGRYINGQVESCQNDGVVFTDSRWLHIEQSKNLRRNDGDGDAVTPDLLIRAINDSIE